MYCHRAMYVFPGIHYFMGFFIKVAHIIYRFSAEPFQGTIVTSLYDIQYLYIF